MYAYFIISELHMTVLFFSLFNISKEQELSGSFLFRLLNIIPK